LDLPIGEQGWIASLSVASSDEANVKELGEDSGKTYETRRTYEGYFRKWILPRWGTYRVKDVRSVAVGE
jgi:hypothetical protein